MEHSIDREKVIAALHCRAYDDDFPCWICAYYKQDEKPVARCDYRGLMDDVITLLKEQDDEIAKFCGEVARLTAMLEEQDEPKQIVRKQCKKEHDDGSIDYFAEWYCPHCKSLIVRGFDNPSIKFCYKCGKPILWEGR